MDNLQEFRDPVNYDLEELPGSADRIAFMCKFALRSAGPVLDLACGTGIVSLPLALLGLPVTGVDLSEPMIAHARRKARALGTRPMASN
jgi:2-polyprenyl-3-methyl-5-hydroxy-6-metoxy-1,4-benzoquinol methylase